MPLTNSLVQNAVPSRPVTRSRSDLSVALAGCRHAFIGIGVFSAAINVLQLTGPVFMLEIYDRVIPGRSIPTLIGISLLALIMFGLQGVLDIVRSRVLVRIAASIDQKVSPRVYDVAAKLPLRAITPRGYQPLHDLDRIRSFMSTVGPAALFDLPWMPLYLGICFLFHPLIGITATVGGLALLWQIHLGRGNVSIHVRQCGHRRGGDRMKSEMMACRTAGKLG
jgi:ATP-binding cassette subfamily C protein